MANYDRTLKLQPKRRTLAFFKLRKNTTVFCLNNAYQDSLGEL